MDENSVVKAINEFVSLLDSVKSKVTAKNYKSSLEMFNESLQNNDGDLAKLTQLDIQLFITSLEAKGNSASTINNRLAAISQFSRFIGRIDITEDIRLLRKRKRPFEKFAPKLIERSEVINLLRRVEKTDNLRDIAIVNVLLRTGIRASELISLNRSEVVIGEGSESIMVHNWKGNDSSSTTRCVPLSTKARVYLSKYLESRDDDDPALFLSNNRQRINVRTVQHMLNHYGVNARTLRRTFINEMYREHVDISTFAKICGDKATNVTLSYYEPTERDINEAIDKAFLGNDKLTTAESSRQAIGKKLTELYKDSADDSREDNTK